MAINPARPTDPLGWPLLPVPDASGSLHWPDLDGSVRQTIRSLLVTRPGERLLHPTLGGALQDFLHQPNTVLTRRRVEDRVTETITLWEPRVTLTRVLVEPDGDHEEKLRVTIDYRLRLTGQTGAIAVALIVGGGN